MNRKQRLMATLRGEPTDRPAVNFYEVGGLVMDPNDPDTFNIYTDPSWKPLLELAETRTDLIRMRSPVRKFSHRAWDPAGGCENARDEFFRTEVTENEDCRVTRTVLKVAGRTMTTTGRRQRDTDTVWTTEHLLKSKQDLLAYLQLPDEVFDETIDISPLIEAEEELGDRGIVMVDTEDPLCAAAVLFSMEDYTVLALTEPKLFHRLLQKLAKPVHKRTLAVAEEFPGHLWRIYGPEFATEPYLPPRLFGEYVVRYTGPMVRMIRKTGGFARVHAHGRIRNVLSMIVEMGADAIDPIEPPPQGDVDISWVRRQYGRDLVLFGNIEIADIETMPRDAFKTHVRRTIEQATESHGKGFVLMPTAAPLGRKLGRTTLENYEAMVQAVEEMSRQS